MKKVNFNALQNFEVPDSWIENALNAKPKKKPFYLNARYIGSAAGFVLAVGISLFSLLYLNHNFTPPTSPTVTGTTVSSSSAKQKNTVSVTNSGTAVTELSETTKVVQATEKKEPTEQTEQNEITDQTDIPEDITPVSDNNHSEEHKETEPYEQPETTEKPEQTVKPQTPTNTVEEPKSTEYIQESTVDTEAKVPLKKISTDWNISIKYSNDPHASEISKITTDIKSTDERTCDILFTNDIEISIPPEIMDSRLIKIKCVIKGKNENTDGIYGELILSFKDSINETIKKGKLQDGSIVVNLSQEFIDIPCGIYDVDFSCYSYISSTEIYYNSISDLLLYNNYDYNDSVKLHF